MQSRFCGLKIGLFSLLFVGAVATLPGQQADKKPITLRVFVPDARARLTIDESLINGEGPERKVTITPKGGADHLVVTATWEPNGYTKISRTRKAPLKGDPIVVDLREADPKNPDKIKVIYVPTPEDVVEAMCKLARVGPDDIVYDLGCGDGRIVITAVSKFKAKKGVGVDLDAALIKECKINAQKEGVGDKVEFRQHDVLDIKDLSTATVVMLYMGEDINLRLKPILQKTLKPGARVVSHCFTMGDWKPAKTETVRSTRGDCDIHLWPIGPATIKLTQGEDETLEKTKTVLTELDAKFEIDESGDRLMVRATLTAGQATEAGLAQLKAANRLGGLELVNVQLTDKSLEHIGGLTKLDRLRFTSTRVPDAGLKQLQKLAGLEGLALPLAMVSDAGLAHLKGLTRLQQLDLSHNPITDAGLDNLKGLTALRGLNLDDTKVTDAGLRQLKGLARLQTLSLRHNPITDAGLSQLHGLLKLEQLDIRGTRITDGGVKALEKNLPKTKVLHAPFLGPTGIGAQRPTGK